MEKGEIALRVLVIDDNQTILNVVGRALTRDGYLVETANEFISGYEKALGVHPDIVISDYDMPNGTGLELFEKLHQSGELPDTNFILMSGHFDTRRKMQDITNKLSAITSFLQKPFTISELRAVLG